MQCHGLERDGKLGPETLKTLNVPVQSRIRPMEINLMRVRRYLDASFKAVANNYTDEWLSVRSATPLRCQIR